MSEIDEMLNFDPLDAAEKISGVSYKQDRETTVLGMRIAQKHAENVRDEMTLRDDTHYSTSFRDTLRIYQEEGFDVVYTHSFPSSSESFSEIFVVLHHKKDNMLVSLSSYMQKSTNTNTMYTNWKPNPELENLWEYTSSGFLNDAGTWVGNWDMRTGLRHILARLRDNGTFLDVWEERPHLWLVDYSQEKHAPQTYPESSNYYKSINNFVLSQMKPHIVKRLGSKEN